MGITVWRGAHADRPVRVVERSARGRRNDVAPACRCQVARREVPRPELEEPEVLAAAREPRRPPPPPRPRRPRDSAGGSGTLGIRVGSGGSPGRIGRSIPPASGTTSSSALVYGCSGRVRTSSAGPISTIRPRYITATRSAIVHARAEVVGHDQHRDLSRRRGASAAARGSRRGPTRRGSRPARRPRSPRARAPARRRSPRAGAGRPTARAGTGGRTVPADAGPRATERPRDESSSLTAVRGDLWMRRPSATDS